jgi:hypothetical protein
LRDRGLALEYGVQIFRVVVMAKVSLHASNAVWDVDFGDVAANTAAGCLS